MADMMERFTNMFRDDPDAGRGRMTDTEGGIEVALGDAIALQRMNGGNVLETFLQSNLPDLLFLAERDPAFANTLANAVKDYPSVLSMMPSGDRMSDMDEVRGNMGRISDMDAAGVGDRMPSPVAPMMDEVLGNMGRMSDRDVQESLIDPNYAPAPEFGAQFRPGENNGPFDRDQAAGTEGGYGMEPMPMEYAYGGYVNKPRAMGRGGYAGGGYVQEQSRPEEENPRPVRRTLSTALSPTLSIKLFG
jgi:hypothetical protein